MPKRLFIFDTTLRDGEQAPGCSMDLHEKMSVARALDRAGVDVVEAGFAASSRGDFLSVKSAAQALQNCVVASLCRCTEQDILTAWDALSGAVSPRLHLLIATSPLHMEHKLRMTSEQVLTRISEAVAFARTKTPDVEFSAEDALRSDPAFLAEAVRTALRAGATTINIPDTVGYALPQDMEALFTFLLGTVEGLSEAVLSVHCHNDLGLAVANSLAAVCAGATQVEGTFNGIGERAGNAALEEIIMAVHTRRDLFPGLTCRMDTLHIARISRLIYGILGIPVPMNKPIVGQNAFSHESGIHQHGVMMNRATYEVIRPESIGLRAGRMILGKHSGRHGVEARLQELGYSLSPAELDELFAAFKALCEKKKEITDEDLEALASRERASEEGGYRLVRFTVNAGNAGASSAVVRLARGDEEREDVCLGDGPVDAAFRVVDRITDAPAHTLEHYTIHSVSEGLDALGESVVKLRRGDGLYTGRGLSTDVIEASILAYISCINKMMGE